ncbi:MAG: hypothetical protein EP305_03215 [Bacteroidetes bacterium]|nr:MAG: hypothetical protein EP305_03215 [Bacteroidota bacterium]
MLHEVYAGVVDLYAVAQGEERWRCRREGNNYRRGIFYSTKINLFRLRSNQGRILGFLAA